MTRYHAIVAIAIALAPGMTCAQEGSPNISCVDRITLPEYPLLAQQSRTSGTVTTTFVLSASGHPDHIETRLATKASSSTLLSAPVETAIRESVFNASCSGKTVELIFTFEIKGSTEGRPKQTIAYGYPNRFWIVSEAPHLQP
jgi:hypothetical protein